MSGTDRMNRDGVRKLLRRARAEGFGVPAFNVSEGVVCLAAPHAWVHRLCALTNVP